MISIGSTFLGLALFIYLCRHYRRRAHITVADISGPKSESFIIGNLRQYFQSQAGEIDLKWHEAYGGVVRFKASFGEDRLMIADPKALQYIFHTSGYTFSKQQERREITRMLTGRGIVWAEGEDHIRHRKIMNPAFGFGEITKFTPVFNYHAAKLTAKWKEIISGPSSEQCVINVASWFGRATLDAMGVATFDYHFGALDDEENELAKAYANLALEGLSAPTKNELIKQVLMPYCPKFICSFFKKQGPSRLQQLQQGFNVGNKIAKEMIDTKSRACSDGKGTRDIMSLLVRANASEDENSRLSEEEMAAQVLTLLLAGYDTTATSLTWAILEIARHSEVQTKLRREIRQKQRELQARNDVEFSATDFESMPYLTAVLKESLRFHPALYSFYREPVKDEVLPLSKPITTLFGKVVTEIPVPKGIKLVTSVNGYHRNPDVFGPDAAIYNPDRWMTVNPRRSEKAVSVGMYGNLLTFSGGVRSCIGWRFAVLEIQAFLVELVNNFEFSLTPEARMVRREACLLTVPTIEGQRDKGKQLPLVVGLAPQDD